VELCVGCGTPLRHLGNLTCYPAQLFNRGLAAARADDLGEARELFAAIVHWCPLDWEARNALALANFQLGDSAAARHHWTVVLNRRPKDPIATRGLVKLDAAPRN
jgi:Flp pilus assembly protein TadD